MKGLELPVNMIIVIAIAVLVLVVIAAFFTGTFIGGTDQTKYVTAISISCTQWRSNGCGSFSINVENEKNVPIATACSKAYPSSGESLMACYQACNCPQYVNRPPQS